MSGRVIQGFFIGGRMRSPATAVRTAAIQRAMPTSARPAPGPPQPAFGQQRTPVQARLAPGRPAMVHQATQIVQRFGGIDSFEIDAATVGLARSGGNPLPQAVLAKMEAAFGADFSAVRVHVGPQASRIGAVAFTTGNDLYFAPGQFQPESVKGQQLIGHELAHVIQQRQGRVRAPGSGIAVVQDRVLEAEADRLGLMASRIANSGFQRSVVQRFGGHGRGVAQMQHHRKVERRVIQRFVAPYVVAVPEGPGYASATITYADLDTGSAASVAAAHIPSHMGNPHPYHHERGHLIARCLGGNGADANNLVGLSDGTNGALMYDMEGTVYDIIAGAGVGASVFMEVTVDYSATHYNGPLAAPYVVGMVGSLEINVYDQAGGAVLFSQRYPNGVVKNHIAAGCC